MEGRERDQRKQTTADGQVGVDLLSNRAYVQALSWALLQDELMLAPACQNLKGFYKAPKWFGHMFSPNGLNKLLASRLRP